MFHYVYLLTSELDPERHYVGLPTNIFYAQCVKANGLFFDRKPAQEKLWTQKLWIYDLRTNLHFTINENTLKRSDLDDFVACYYGCSGAVSASHISATVTDRRYSDRAVRDHRGGFEVGNPPNVSPSAPPAMKPPRPATKFPFSKPCKPR